MGQNRCWLFDRPAQAQIFEIAALDPTRCAAVNFSFHFLLRTNRPTNHGYNLKHSRLVAWKWGHCPTTRTTLSILVCQGPMQEVTLTWSPSLHPLRLIHPELQN